jgi:lipoate synthase
MTCVTAARSTSPIASPRCASIRRERKIEVLVPDFAGASTSQLDILAATPPDVMNHNMETVPRLYKQARPGADYANSLQLLQAFQRARAGVPTKSGLDGGPRRDRRGNPRHATRPARPWTSRC